MRVIKFFRFFIITMFLLVFYTSYVSADTEDYKTTSSSYGQLDLIRSPIQFFINDIYGYPEENLKIAFDNSKYSWKKEGWYGGATTVGETDSDGYYCWEYSNKDDGFHFDHAIYIFGNILNEGYWFNEEEARRNTYTYEYKCKLDLNKYTSQIYMEYLKETSVKQKMRLDIIPFMSNESTMNPVDSIRVTILDTSGNPYIDAKLNTVNNSNITYLGSSNKEGYYILKYSEYENIVKEKMILTIQYDNKKYQIKRLTYQENSSDIIITIY